MTEEQEGARAEADRGSAEIDGSLIANMKYKKGSRGAKRECRLAIDVAVRTRGDHPPAHRTL